MGHSEGEVVEVAIDRMYREEVRFGNLKIGEGHKPEENYNVEKKKRNNDCWIDPLGLESYLEKHCASGLC